MIQDKGQHFLDKSLAIVLIGLRNQAVLAVSYLFGMTYDALDSFIAILSHLGPVELIKRRNSDADFYIVRDFEGYFLVLSFPGDFD